MRTGPRTGFRWTHETIATAITLWYRKHSRTPLTSEWTRPARPSIEADGRPRLRSCNAAMLAAGFTPRPRGRQPRSLGRVPCRRVATRRLLPGDGIDQSREEARLTLELLLPDVRARRAPDRRRGDPCDGDALPDETLDACRAATAVLKGPSRSRVDAADVRPELAFSGLAPPRRYVREPAAGSGSPTSDVLIVRELVGGPVLRCEAAYAKSTSTTRANTTRARSSGSRGVPSALAQARDGLLTSVDKATCSRRSRMWRRGRRRAAPEYPDVQVEHMLVDNAAMQWRFFLAPEQFDVARVHRETCSVTSSPTWPRR